MKDLRNDPAAIEKLAASGLVLSGLALGALVHRRFRLLALAGCGLLTASALTGFSPLSSLMPVAETGEVEDEALTPRKVGVPPIAALGVPHRIPEEEVLSQQDPNDEISDFE